MKNTPICNPYQIFMKHILTLLAGFAGLASYAQSYTSYLTGSDEDLDVQPEFGIVLMGGAGEDDFAMTWFLERANGGDVVVIRTSGSDGYNDYLFSGLGVNVNSVESIVFDDPSASEDPYVIERLQNAEAIWMAGGNQATYVDYWRGTAVEDAINNLMNVRGGVVGGISAGMAVLGGTYFSAQNGTVYTDEALEDPYNMYMTLGHNDFLEAPFLDQVVTDTHYDDPDRRGRHMTFMARMQQDEGIYPLGIACDEYGAVCIDADGMAWCYGEAPQYDDYVYFVRPACSVPTAPNACAPGELLDWNYDGQALKVLRVAATPAGDQYLDLNDWLTHNGGEWFDWTVDNGNFSQMEGSAPDCAVGVAKNEAREVLELYPNPAVQAVNITCEPGEEVVIFDLNGRMLHREVSVNDNFTLTLDDYSAGVYFVMAGNRRAKLVVGRN